MAQCIIIYKTKELNQNIFLYQSNTSSRMKAKYVLTTKNDFYVKQMPFTIGFNMQKFAYKKLDDSAFFRTQSYITEICYFEYLPSLLFGWQKPFFSPVQSNIKSLFAPIHIKKLTKSEIRSSWSQFEHCSESLVWSIGSHFWSLLAPIHMKIRRKVKLGQVGIGSNNPHNHSFDP